MKQYGLPYQGSKNLIAKKIIDFLPPAENFYDLFAGGCAITHAAIESGKYRNIIFNDIQPMITQLFLDAVEGKYKNERRWISREDFFALKDTDAYVKYCWSFGNSGDNYLYSAEIEPWKKAAHFARVLGDWSLLEAMDLTFSEYEKANIRTAITKRHAECKAKYIKWYLKNIARTDIDFDEEKKNLEEKIAKNSEELRRYLLDALKESGLTQSEVDRRTGTQMSGHYFGKSQWLFPTEEEYNKMRAFLPLKKDYWEIYRLQNLLQSLQSLQRLQRLERLEKGKTCLTRMSASYDEIEILPDSIIYCDIPYRGTRGYNGDRKSEGFDYEKFYSWAERQTELCFISEYNMP